MLALADKAIASQGIEYLVIHGVERIKPDWGYQDFWALKQDIFFGVLDGLQARRDAGKLWITDHISAHQYETERNSAKVEVLDQNPRSITLKVTCDADPELYDEPLTLVTCVPANWRTCVLTQAGSKTDIEVSSGMVLYEVVPKGQLITLQGK